MSALFLLDQGEDALIDNTRYHAAGVQTTVSHQADPGEQLMSVGENVPAELPSASVGGQNGTGNWFGWSTGFVGARQKIQPFLGAVLSVPRETLPVQGNVGASARATRQYAGVMDQLTQYTPSQSEYVSSYLGAVPNMNVITSNGR